MSTTRDKLIEAGHNLFYREGFISVGLDRILMEVRCSKQTFYNHFDSKDDLIIAVLDEHNRWWQRELVDQMQRRGGPDPRAQLLAIFDILDGYFLDEDYYGCLFINAAVEFPNPNHPAHRMAAEQKAETRRILTALADQAGASDPEAFVEELDMLLEGAMVVQQVGGNVTRASAIARRAAETLMDKYMPAPV
jgi:AcrR family transcriptional regulator